MMELEGLLEAGAEDLRGKVRIAPISTMLYPPGRAAIDIVREDLDRIEGWMAQGWLILGWQNQATIGTDRPYAIGGGIAGVLPQAVSDLIQGRFKQWEAGLS